jgi:pimeloyl-ACP methyl ester carboxylesterase
MEDYQQYCQQGTKCVERMIKVNENVSLNVVSFSPANNSNYCPIVMLGGLATLIESFRPLLGELTKDCEVHYIETREKSSSQISGKAKFDIETVGLDIVSIIQTLELKENNYMLFGYSFGATVIIDSYCHLESKPQCMLLLSPTPTFNYPAWSLPIIRLAVPLYPLLKPTAKWYLRNFQINRKEDNEMYLISSRALDKADPQKLKSTILSVVNYIVWERLKLIQCPTLIVATSKDGLHVHEDIKRMENFIKKSDYIDLENNKRSHSAELAIIIRNYLAGKLTYDGIS